jgi:predicted nucleic acid-binding protein
LEGCSPPAYHPKRCPGFPIRSGSVNLYSHRFQLILRDDALAIALEYNCAVYAAGYLALAMNSGLPLITADERLVRSLAARFPVQWIGALGAVSS